MFTKLCLIIIVLGLLTPVTMAGYYKLDPINCDAGEEVETKLILTPAIKNCDNEVVQLTPSDNLRGVVVFSETEFSCNNLKEITLSVNCDYSVNDVIHARHYCKGGDGQSVDVVEDIELSVDVSTQKKTDSNSGGGGGGSLGSIQSNEEVMVTPTTTQTVEEPVRSVTPNTNNNSSVETNTEPPASTPKEEERIKESGFNITFILIGCGLIGLISLILWRYGKK